MSQLVGSSLLHAFECTEHLPEYYMSEHASKQVQIRVIERAISHHIGNYSAEERQRIASYYHPIIIQTFAVTKEIFSYMREAIDESGVICQDRIKASLQKTRYCVSRYHLPLEIDTLCEEILQERQTPLLVGEGYRFCEKIYLTVLDEADYESRLSYTIDLWKFCVRTALKVAAAAMGVMCYLYVHSEDISHEASLIVGSTAPLAAYFALDVFCAEERRYPSLADQGQKVEGNIPNVLVSLNENFYRRLSEEAANAFPDRIYKE